LFRDLARLSFTLTLFAIPLRYRIVILERPHPSIYKDYTDVLFFASDLFLLLTLGFWLVSLALASPRLRLRPYFLTLPVIVLPLAGLISAFASIDPLLSAYHTLRLFVLAGFYLYVLNEVASLSWLVLPVALQVLVQASIAIGQVLKQHDLGLQVFGEYALDPDWPGVSIVMDQGERFLRAYGLSDHPNLLGGCLAFGLLVIAAWYITSGSRWRWLAIPISAIGAIGLFLTFSRSAWLALALAGGFMTACLFLLRQRLPLARLVGMLAAGVIATAPFLWVYAGIAGVRLNRGDSLSEIPQEVQSLGARQLLNDSARQLFSQNPLTGAGLGTFPLALQRLYPEFRTQYQPVHFTLLEAAAETGIFGSLFYGLALLTPWLALWLNRRRLVFTAGDSHFQSDCHLQTLPLIGVSGLLLAVTVVGLFDYYTWLLAPGRLWQWLAWGLWAVAFRSSIREPDE
jgi:O-antigen ligase